MEKRKSFKTPIFQSFHYSHLAEDHHKAHLLLKDSCREDRARTESVDNHHRRSRRRERAHDFEVEQSSLLQDPNSLIVCRVSRRGETTHEVSGCHRVIGLSSSTPMGVITHGPHECSEVSRSMGHRRSLNCHNS